MSVPSDSIFLQVYDVIKIDSPTNELYNDKRFLIDYIDNIKLKIINTETNETFTLLLNSDKSLQDESIQTFVLLKRGASDGFAKQNNLLPDVWIDVHFGGEFPSIITGQISNLEEDMIEIKLYPSNDHIYIDFAYKGIPEELFIEEIKIRPPPSITKSTDSPDGIDETSVSQDVVEKSPEEEADEDEQYDIYGTSPTPDFTEDVNKVLLESQDNIFGKAIGEISIMKEVDKRKQRFGIDTQTGSLLDDLLAHIPTSQRDIQVMTSLNLMIQRFIQLRDHFSEFDDYGNALMPKKKGAVHRPLIHQLQTFDKNHIPILPVAELHNLFFSPHDNAQDLHNLNEMFENYKKNNTPSDNNKYKYFLRSIDTFLTPYELTNNPLAMDTLHLHNDVDILTQHVEIDDYDDTFATQQRNMNPKITNQRILDTERIQPRGIMIMSKPVIDNSKQYLPGTSILSRAGLNEGGYYSKTNIGVTQKIIIDNLETAFDYNTIPNFLTKNLHITLSDSVEEHDVYDKFLNVIIPRTKKLFEYTNKYNTGNLSLYSLVSELEPFMVYTDDITYKLYEDMNEFLKEKILGYKKTYKQKQKVFQGIIQNTIKHVNGTSTPFHSIIQLLKDSKHPKTKDDLLDEVMFQVYFPGSIDMNTKTDSELIRTIYALDKGKLLCSAIVLSNLHLLETVNIQDELEKGNVQYEEYIEKEKKSDNSCETLTLAKKYIELDELLEDNEKTIYYDKQYDQTRYDIIEEYRDEQDTKTPDEFNLFLTEKLQESIGLDEESARTEAEAMIQKKKTVVDNDYAILDENGKKNKYYRRVLNKWILNEGFEGVDITDNMFCNIKPKCFTLSEKCMNLDVTESVMKRKSLENLLKEFDLSHELSIEDLTNVLLSNFAYYKNQVQQIRRMNQINNYKYNNIRYNIGLEKLSDGEIIIKSPYAEVLELILGQPDFVKKQNHILKFKRSFTREAGEKESTYWFYCIKTNTKLLPTFIPLMASTYLDGGNYLGTMEKIRKDRGKVSDDQSYWVDKHSGRKISDIDFSDEEGRNEAGYKVSTNDLLEEEQKISLDDMENLQDMIEDPDALTVYKILVALTNYMYINVEEYYLPIIQNVLNLFTRKIISEDEHKKREARASAKGRKIKSYEDSKNYLLIIITASYLHMFVQTAIPNIKTKKTFPGCIKSFDGFPLDKSSNIDGIIYISCIILKIKAKSIIPWNSVSGIKSDALSQTIRDLIENDILKDVAMERMITKKMEYITSGAVNVDIPIEHDVSNWNTFLPPLVDFKMKSLQALGSGFIDSVVEKMKSGTAHQDDDILTIRSKIIGFSFQILEKINKQTRKEDALLKNNAGESFLENTCCINTDAIQTPIEYFISKDASIMRDMSTVKDYMDIIIDISEIPLAPYYLYDTNTKLVIPSESYAFKEKVIYNYFITTCNFKNDIPLHTDFERIGIKKPDNFPKHDSLSDQITFLKHENISYDSSALTSLLKVVNRRNTIKSTSANDEPISRIQKIRDMLHFLKRTNDTSIPAELQELLTALLDTFEIGVKTETPEIEAIKNYLAKENDKMKTDITKFLLTHGRSTSKEMAPVMEFINESTIWTPLREEENVQFQNIEHNSVYRILEFILDCINNLCYIYPNIILRKTEYDKIKINKHWGFSEDHNADIKKMIMSYYSFLPQFYDENFESILVNIQEECKNIFVLCTIIPCFSPINIPSSDKTVVSIFDKVTATFLYEYCLLKIYSYYINNVTTIGNMSASSGKDVRFSEVSTDAEIDDIRTGNYGDEEDIVDGVRLESSEKIASLLIIFTKRFMTNKSNINLSYEDIMKKISRSSDKEKTIKTTRLKEFTEEQRDINKLFKSHKLGEWGKGLQKGLTQYVKETYDEERSEIFGINGANIQSGNFDMNTHFTDEVVQQLLDDEAIEAEEMSISHLPDDDDYGENDGDEGY